MLNLVFCFVECVLLLTAFGQFNPNFRMNLTDIVQLFEWPFEDAAMECETFLSQIKFGCPFVYYEHIHYQLYEIKSFVNSCQQSKKMSMWLDGHGGKGIIRFLIEFTPAPHEGQLAVQCGGYRHLYRCCPCQSHHMSGSREIVGTASSIASNRNNLCVPYNDDDSNLPCDIESFNMCQLFHLNDLNQHKEHVR